jgi:Family of unknown function (DUF6085)
MLTKIVGHCPMGCGQTLFASEGGHITCSYALCPNPGVVDDILKDNSLQPLVKTLFGKVVI